MGFQFSNNDSNKRESSPASPKRYSSASTELSLSPELPGFDQYVWRIETSKLAKIATILNF